MTNKFKPLKPDDLDIFYEWSQTHFAGKHAISSVQLLSEPDRRNGVLRIHLSGSEESIPNSVILKQSVPELSDADDEEAYARFARDWAGLEFLSMIPQPAHNVPKFYGANKEYRFIVIEDLGDKHISLVDSLTIPDKTKAIASLTRFMKALGSYHASTFGHTDLYEKKLKQINPQADSRAEELEIIMGDILPKFQQVNTRLGLSVSLELIEEAQEVISSMLRPGPFTVLIHGDICPDNVFDHEGQDLQLIDFEWAFVRNALLDGTYLRMSMPTCWCAKAVPTEIIDAMEKLYRQELIQSIPAASDDTSYYAAYVSACAFWLLQQTLPHLDSVIEKDRVGPSGPVPEGSLWKPEDNTVRPRVLTRLQAFIQVSTQYDTLPHLREMAGKMLEAARLLWPDANYLEYYPAFR